MLIDTNRIPCETADHSRESWRTDLEGQALEIVSSDAQRQCIQAGPGTGKSFCMTRRILRLIEQARVEPRQILAVTFTRAAANDLRRELESALPPAYEGFRVGTLHSVCNEIVAEEHFAAARHRVPRFLLTASNSSNLGFEAAPLLQDLGAEHGTPTDKSKRIKAFEAMWARRQRDPLGVPIDGDDAAFGTALLSWLRFHRGMLIGELVPLAYEYLANEPSTPWLTKYKAVLIDEYQDLNKADQEVLDLLSSAATTTVVGDLDQSIYSFRCAHPEGLSQYASRDDVEFETMDISRRCPTKHLEVSRRLIQQNVCHSSAALRPYDPARVGRVVHRRWNTLDQQTIGIVENIKWLLTQGVSPGRILVMASARKIGQDLKRALVEEDIDAQSYFSEELVQDPEAQQALTLLRLAINPRDRVSLRCWLGAWLPHSNATQYAKLRSYCENNHTEPFDVLSRIAIGECTDLSVPRLSARFSLLAPPLAHIQQLKGQDLLDNLFPETKEWAVDIRVAIGENMHEETNASDLHEYLIDAIVQPYIPTEVNHVRIMSLYKAKGLTSDASVVAGLMQGLIPKAYDSAKTDLTPDQHLEEQRRLLYVALTRSRQHLLVCSASTVPAEFAMQYQIPGKSSGSKTRRALASEFITSLGQALDTPTASTEFS